MARPNDFNTHTINNEKIIQVYLDDPFSPLNTLDRKFYNKLDKSFSYDKKVLVESKSIDEI